MSAHARQTKHHRTIGAPLPKPVRVALVAIVVWAVLVVAADALWRHAFGFSAGGAWALAIGLVTYVMVFVLFILGIVPAVRRD